MTIAGTLGEVTRFHRVVPHSDVDTYVDELMNKVGMRPDDKTKYPHEFSGGQKQRIGIARALAVQPQFIVADEPVSALDVSIQAQVLNLMQDLKDEFQLTLMFISHDLKVVNHFCDRLIVMYLGHVVEELRCNNLTQDAKHPYTQALLGANPINDPDERRPLTVLEGDVPSPYNPPPGCPFAGRCSMVTDRCRVENPPLVQIGTDHEVACWEVAPPTEQTPVTQDAAS
jgi:oligopeptide/dipeptide ABC transporter ATP-binding protein